MANVKVEFLQTSAGAYGLAQTGDKVVVSEADAKQLEKNGVVKVVGNSSDDVTVPESGSVVIREEKQGGAPAGETDPKDATGKAAAKKAAAKKSGKK